MLSVVHNTRTFNILPPCTDRGAAGRHATPYLTLSPTSQTISHTYTGQSLNGNCRYLTMRLHSNIETGALDEC